MVQIKMKVFDYFRNLISKSQNTSELERIIVNAFIISNSINVTSSTKIVSYLNQVDLDSTLYILAEISNEGLTFSLDDLIQVFEILVPSSERKDKGVVYTPVPIAEYIVKNTIGNKKLPKICDPSCGCGVFLIETAKQISQLNGISYKECFEKYIFGVDIDSDAIRRAEILCSLFLLLNDEDDNVKFNFYCGDMLSKETFKKLKMTAGGFDCVLGNPPYVRNRNIPEKTKQHFSQWETTKAGNVDLYIPFFEIGIELLNETGSLGFITPNTYLQSINGRSLRNYLKCSSLNLEILDFRDSQIFEKVTSYTCITIINKSKSDGLIKYARIQDANQINQHIETCYLMSSFESNAPWRMCDAITDENIKKIESIGTPLANWKIRNGIATLKNDLFIFSPLGEDSHCFKRSYKGKEYLIEKDCCIKIAKPNTIKNEVELEEKAEFAIYPYSIKNGKIEVIEENTFKKKYPNAYDFLYENKEELKSRDKGKGNYPVWYAYGRTQGLNNQGYKLLIPYMSGEAIAVLSLDPELLFYCGYAIISDNIEELKLLRLFLKSKIFWYYLCKTSKPYAKGYMSLAKNYIAGFSIPELSEDEKEELFNIDNQKDRDVWICNKYNIDINALVL